MTRKRIHIHRHNATIVLDEHQYVELLNESKVRNVSVSSVARARLFPKTNWLKKFIKSVCKSELL